MKFNTIISIGLIVTMITGCSSSLSSKAIEQGKLALADGDLKKALNSFELAVEEGSNDDEIQYLIKTISLFNNSRELFEKDKIEESEAELLKIDSHYKKYSLKDNIDELRLEIIDIQEGRKHIDEELKEIDNLIDKSKYEDSNIKIDELKKNIDIGSTDQKNKFNNQVELVREKISNANVASTENKQVNQSKEKDVEIITPEQAKNLVIEARSIDLNHEAISNIPDMNEVRDGVLYYYFLSVPHIMGRGSASTYLVNSKTKKIISDIDEDFYLE